MLKQSRWNKVIPNQFSYNIPILIVTCKRDSDDLIIRENCYEKVLVPNITQWFELDELVTYLTNRNKRFPFNIQVRSG